MQKDTKVSIVVPIYNVEKYLDRCVKSIAEQTYKNLEIILVDDGSPDQCPKLCEDWAKRDDRIKVVHKKNAGLGMARNTGIDNATGDYICFVDSDDYIASDTIQKACNKAMDSNADIVYFGYTDVDTDGNILKEYKPEIVKLDYKKNEIYEELLPELISPDYSCEKRANLMLSACTALFSLHMIQKADWRFVSEHEIISEDVYSLIKLFSYVRSAAVVPEALYFYCKNEASLTRSYKENRYNRIKFFYDEVIKLCDICGYPPIIKQRLGGTYLSFTIGALKSIIQSNMPFGHKLSAVNLIVKDPHLKKALSTVESEIESNSRKLILKLLLKGNTFFCFSALYIRYGLRSCVLAK